MEHQDNLQLMTKLPVAQAFPVEAQMLLLEEKYDVPRAGDPSLVTVASTPGFTSTQRTPGSPWFNGVENLETREVTVSGVQVPFDGSIPVLQSLRLTRDVTRMTVIADEVVIEQQLAWKGADVTIIARRLTFRDEGCISTTPEPYGVGAFSEKQDDQGRPLPGKNEKVRGKDGLPGCKAGTIKLLVKEIDLGGTGVLRFDCLGGEGQKGEPGGYLPRSDGKPVSAATVLMQTIVDNVNNAANSTGDLNGLGHWYYPAGEANQNFGGQQPLTTDLYGGLAGRGLIAAGTVTHVRIIFTYVWFGRSYFTSVDLPNYVKTDSNEVIVGDPNRPLPPVAYPSGKTGQGGAGGALVVPNEFVRVVAGSYRGDGGASPASDAVAGKAGTPSTYQVLTYQFYENSCVVTDPPSLPYRIMEYKAEHGEGLPGSRADDGTRGEIAAAPNDQNWLDARLVRTVLTYARCLASMGQRAEALGVLRPYADAAGVPRESDELGLGTSLQAVTALYTNLSVNLDAYGNPGGWVPRFSADTYFQLYLGDRGFSYRFAYAMAKALALSDSIESAWRVMQYVSAQNESHIDQLHGELGRAYADIHDARDTLDEAVDHLKAVSTIIEKIKSQATKDAEEKAKRDAIINAVVSTAGAICSALPVGQPFVAGVGAVLTGIGAAISQTDDSKSSFDNALGFLGGLSTSVASTLETNADMFKDQFDDRLQAKYKDKVDPAKKDLKKQIATARTGMLDAKASADKLTEETFNNVTSNADLAKLLMPENDELITSLAENRVELKAKLDEANKLLVDVPATGANAATLPGELAARNRQKVGAVRAKLYAQLADLDRLLTKKRQAAADVKATLEEKKKAMTEMEAAAKARDDVEARKETLDGLVGKLEQQQSEEADNDAKATFATIVSSSTKVAKGLAQSASAIQTALRPVSAEDQSVQKLRDKFLGGAYHDQLKNVLDQLDQAKTKRAAALQGFQDCNRRMLSGIADLHHALEASVAFSRSSQALAAGIDPGVKLHMQAMAQSAAERMDYYLYLVRKAYMYEQLATVGPGVAQLNDFTRRFDNWLAANQVALKGKVPGNIDLTNATGQLAAVASVAGSDITSMGDLVLKETLAELTDTILRRRQVTDIERSNSGLLVSLSAQRCESLVATDEGITIEHVMALFTDADATKFLSKHKRVRVAEIALKNFVFQPKDQMPTDPIRLELTVGNTFPLRGDDAPDGSPRYYLFRLAERETPTKISFVISDFKTMPPTDGKVVRRVSGTVTPDTTVVPNDFFRTLSAKGSGASVTYSEMSPSVMSSLSLELVMGAEQIKHIEILTFGLTLKFDG